MVQWAVLPAKYFARKRYETRADAQISKYARQSKSLSRKKVFYENLIQLWDSVKVKVSILPDVIRSKFEFMDDLLEEEIKKQTAGSR